MRRLSAEVIPGAVFSRLKVIEFSHIDTRKRKWWRCVCECGNERVLHTGNMTSGNTRSCGCLRRDSHRARRISIQHSNITGVIKGYQRHAEGRNLCWNLSREQVEKIILQPCHYCGGDPGNIKETKNSIEPLFYNGIDRVDNARGYDIENVVPCCKICNRSKQDMKLEDFCEWAQRIKRHVDKWT